MIPSLILGISLVFMSVLWTKDIFTIAQKNREAKIERFIKFTRDSLKKEDGSLSVLCALLIAFVAGIAVLFITLMDIEYHESKYRSHSYLCFHYLNKQTTAYIEAMANFNKILTPTYIATLSPKTTAVATPLFRALKIARDAKHFSYMKNIISNKHCPSKEMGLNYLANWPFEQKLKSLLKTEIDGTTIIRKKEWTNYLYQKPSQIRLSKTFALESKFSLEDKYFPKVKNTHREIAMPDFSKLKLPSGFPFSF